MTPFANDKINLVWRRVENTVGRGENAGDPHFLLFPQCFQNVSFSGHQKQALCGKRIILYKTFPSSDNPITSISCFSYTVITLFQKKCDI